MPSRPPVKMGFVCLPEFSIVLTPTQRECPAFITQSLTAFFESELGSTSQVFGSSRRPRSPQTLYLTKHKAALTVSRVPKAPKKRYNRRPERFGKAQSSLIAVSHNGNAVAEYPGVQRPTGVDVRFSVRIHRNRTWRHCTFVMSSVNVRTVGSGRVHHSDHGAGECCHVTAMWRLIAILQTSPPVELAPPMV